MDIPDWRTSRAGSKVRVALWLIAEVGTGGTFTKADLRAAFPAVEQVDRRMRDLRAEGWVIATYREDPSLAAEELRVVTVGARVWEPGYRPPHRTVPARERRAVLARDDYACRYCGISAGETYPDDPLRTAKLSAAKARVGRDSSELLTLCDRCMAGTPDAPSVQDLILEIRALEPEDQQHLLSWIQRGQRHWKKSEVLWARYRRLPAEAREEIEASLDSQAD
jgi:5-methylcytosine-specific restriction endonuclease McrA